LAVVCIRRVSGGLSGRLRGLSLPLRQRHHIGSGTISGVGRAMRSEIALVAITFKVASKGSNGSTSSSVWESADPLRGFDRPASGSVVRGGGSCVSPEREDGPEGGSPLVFRTVAEGLVKPSSASTSTRVLFGGELELGNGG